MLFQGDPACLVSAHWTPLAEVTASVVPGRTRLHAAHQYPCLFESMDSIRAAFGSSERAGNENNDCATSFYELNSPLGWYLRSSCLLVDMNDSSLEILRMTDGGDLVYKADDRSKNYISTLVDDHLCGIVG